ncbi:Piso0_000628 [Millerozyma farinosa CBS 7064]|uniref:Piso0_000628 protein n=1 Tax=Pichia sorbitophila (strain ATCC MYA-4447 / BCRC 22081 / CBS 7064 / NBRC 10061 / NRRL Y-12695) TaxID=559304 RepID=G8YR29_PICSO|nr:Piso0_000628 [Millerozyma farinosa CBS 7064]
MRYPFRVILFFNTKFNIQAEVFANSNITFLVMIHIYRSLRSGKTFSTRRKCFYKSFIRQIQNQKKDKSSVKNDASQKKVSATDLVNALQHKSKLRLTHNEIKNLDKDFEASQPRKGSKNYITDLNKNVLSPKIQKAIEKEEVRKRQSKEKQGVEYEEKQNQKDVPVDTTDRQDLKAKTNEKLMGSFSSSQDGSKLNKIRKSYNIPDVSKGIANKRKRLEDNSNVAHKEEIVITEDLKQVQKFNSSKVARLGHNLDHVLFSPGFHFLQDPRTRIYNFPPFLKNIIKVDEFNFDSIEKFVSASKDTELLRIASETGKKFYSSTSSLTSSLMQFYMLLNNYIYKSEDRFPFPRFSMTFEKSASSVIIEPKGMNEKNGERIYSIESDKSADTEILLSAMGHCLETLLTTDEEEFKKYTMAYKNETKNDKSDNEKPNNIYNYAEYGSFLMRSQLDCFDERLPGNGTFDLKTRAVCTIRNDSKNPNMENDTYQIWKLKGRYESFEREYNDLIKTGALLKYAFQARIGQMDGIYVAYHNLNSFFGFQYLPLSEIDNVFYNQSKLELSRHIGAKKLEDLADDLPSYVADTQFKMSLDIWDRLIRTVISDLEANPNYKGSAFRLVFKTFRRPRSLRRRMKVSAVPLSKEQVSQLQEFSRSFRTSFREDISVNERSKNLEDHREKLNKFNYKTSTSDIGVLSYYIDVEQYFGNSNLPAKSLHPYPKSKTQPWKIAFSIHRLTGVPDSYLSMLNASTSLLSLRYKDESSEVTGKDSQSTGNTFSRRRVTPTSDVYKVYSAIGKARADVWSEKDSNPIIYEPRT